MNGFFPRRYHPEDVQQYEGQDSNNGQHMMDMSGSGGMNLGPGAQSLDDIVNQNAKDRRRSMPVPFGGQQGDLDDSMRRASVAEMFGDNSPQMDAFQFDQNFDSTMMDAPSHSENRMRQRNGSNGSLQVNTQFQLHNAGYGQMNQSTGVFESPMHGQAFGMDMNSPYLTSAFPSQSMGNDMGMMGNDMSTSNLFGGPFESPMTGSPLHPGYDTSMLSQNLQDPGGGSELLKEHRGSILISATPESRISTSRTTSNETVSQAPSNQLNASMQPSNMGQSGQGTPSSNPQKSPPGLPDTINGSVLPWVAPSSQCS